VNINMRLNIFKCSSLPKFDCLLTTGGVLNSPPLPSSGGLNCDSGRLHNHSCKWTTINAINNEDADTWSATYVNINIRLYLLEGSSLKTLSIEGFITKYGIRNECDSQRRCLYVDCNERECEWLNMSMCASRSMWWTIQITTSGIQRTCE